MFDWPNYHYTGNFGKCGQIFKILSKTNKTDTINMKLGKLKKNDVRNIDKT